MQNFNLQIDPTGILPVVYVSQGDVGRQFKIKVMDGDGNYTFPSGVTARINGIKPDNKGFSYPDAVSVSGNEITVTTKQQMTIVSGDVICEIRISKEGLDIGSLNFKMIVEPSPVNENTDISETVLPEIFALATYQMNISIENATKSQSYAVGGTGSRSGENTDNSKYYKEHAAGSAASASADAATALRDSLKAEGYAVGEQNGTPVSSSSPYYHNNSKYYSDRAEAFSTNVPYIGANGNWWIWSVSDNAYIDSGVDASITVDIADITMLDPSATPYVTNSGTNTDPIFHLFIPRGKGITSIAKTGTSGLVDTYTITFSDGYTTTYTVTNGKTAYQSAVEGGYPDSEYDFETDLANFGDWAQETSDNAAIARQAAIDAENEADRAQIYADFIEPHFVIANNRLYIKDDAQEEFLVANNRLYFRFAS